ncbi:MAG: hypothetical protein P0107_03005 [Nitrosomonas sp.]|nr:hypothetical protein [Nitrosomonas sp.]MDL1864907.1 hypothetical protein [Betaproteobacteria bacterium PRO5]
MTNRLESRTMYTKHQQSVREVFLIPALLSVAVLIGLVAALIGDGIWDMVSWLTILAPVVVVILAWRRRGES